MQPFKNHNTSLGYEKGGYSKYPVRGPDVLLGGAERTSSKLADDEMNIKRTDMVLN